MNGEAKRRYPKRLPRKQTSGPTPWARRGVLLSALVLGGQALAGGAGQAQEQPAVPDALSPTPASGGVEGAESAALYFDALDKEFSKMKIVSASKQEEPLDESPVPVTVITEEMIRQNGIRNLQDALTMFVPGMTLVADHNEMNVAERGIYASSQQKILFMLDGHRLNSRAFSSADPDYGIDLHKVKRIEVLRGPGSSLYGNVALMGVVNIVTKSGKEASGVELRGGGGSYGQATGGFLVGDDLGKDHELLLWGNAYRADGQKVFVPASQDISAFPQDGYARVGGASDPGSYDVGGRYRNGFFSLLGFIRQGKYTEPFTSSGTTGESYDYNQVRRFESIGPGLSSRSSGLEARVDVPMNKALSFNASLYYDTNDLAGVYTINPQADTAQYIFNNEDAFGATADLTVNYDLGRYGHGNVIVGSQVERMRLIDSDAIAESGGTWTNATDTAGKQVITPGGENSYSGYVQLKHKLFDQLVFNVGVRLDEKVRRTGETIGDASPRVAVAYIPNSRFNVKLSYAESFVDAPYWYRYNTISSYRGAVDLTPEHLRSIQLNPTLTLGRFRTSLNLFNDYVHDFIFRNNNALPTQPIYQNAGSLRSWGIEDEAQYLAEAYQLRANFTYQAATSAKDYGARDSRIYNVPPFVANLVATFNPIQSIYRNLWLNLTAHIASTQLSPISAVFTDTNGNVIQNYNLPNNEVAAYATFNAGIHLNDLFKRGLDADLTVYNVFDKRYQQGGSPKHPYPQPGRWVLATLSYHFNP